MYLSRLPLSPDAPFRPVSRLILAALSSILVGRLLLQFALHQAGFIALTADEFGRTVIAALWAQHPTPILSGFWLPFHTYLLGSVVALGGDWWITVGLFTVILSVCSLILMFRLGNLLDDTCHVGLLSAFLLALNPVHLWLSAVPLTEIAVFTGLITFVVAYLCYMHAETPRYLWLSVAALAISNGIRYEAWLWSLLFSGSLVLQCIRTATKRHRSELAFAAIVPWIIPLCWVIGNAWQTGDPFYFYTFTTAYERTWYGAERNYAAYAAHLVRIDPFLIALSIVGLGLLFVTRRQERVVRSYVIMAVVPFLLFIVVQGGMRVPEGQMYRRFALFMWFLYPLMAYCLGWLLMQLRQRWPRGWWFVAGAGAAVVGAFQLTTAFSFSNDPASQGLAVGREIARVRLETPLSEQGTILVERVYWHYLAIQVGANDVSGLRFDRIVDDERLSQSWLLMDTNMLRTCVQEQNIRTIVVNSEDLQKVVVQTLKGRFSSEINGYQFYIIPLKEETDSVATGLCPESP